MRALLIAQSDAVTRVCWRALQSAGYAVQIVADDVGASVALADSGPDIVILDATSDPFAARKTQRRLRGRGSRSAVIALVNASDPDIAVQLRNDGVIAVVPTEDGDADLVANLSAALRQVAERGDTMAVAVASVAPGAEARHGPGVTLEGGLQRAVAALAREIGHASAVLDGHLQLLGDERGEGDADVLAMARAVEQVRLLAEHVRAFDYEDRGEASQVHLGDFAVELEPLVQALLGRGRLVHTSSSATTPWITVDARRLRQLVARTLMTTSGLSSVSIVTRDGDSAALELALIGAVPAAASLAGLRDAGRACGVDVRFDAAASEVVLSLPRSRRQVETIRTSPFRRASVACDTQVLLVEDEPMLRHMIARVLRRMGLSVTDVASAEEALALAQGEGERWSLLVTDVCLPQRSGTALARALARERIDVPTLFVSGYVDHATVARELGGEVEFLQKPFRQQDLSERVRTLLERVA